MVAVEVDKGGIGGKLLESFTLLTIADDVEVYCGALGPKVLHHGDEAIDGLDRDEASDDGGIKFVSPERKDQVNNRKRKGVKGGRPLKLDANRYKDRNVVGRFFSRAKQWRGLATRFDKRART